MKPHSCVISRGHRQSSWDWKKGYLLTAKVISLSVGGYKHPDKKVNNLSSPPSPPKKNRSNIWFNFLLVNLAFFLIWFPPTPPNESLNRVLLLLMESLIESRPFSGGKGNISPPTSSWRAPISPKCRLWISRKKRKLFRQVPLLQGR